MQKIARVEPYLVRYVQHHLKPGFNYPVTADTIGDTSSQVYDGFSLAWFANKIAGEKWFALPVFQTKGLRCSAVSRPECGLRVMIDEQYIIIPGPGAPLYTIRTGQRLRSRRSRRGRPRQSVQAPGPLRDILQNRLAGVDRMITEHRLDARRAALHARRQRSQRHHRACNAFEASVVPCSSRDRQATLRSICTACGVSSPVKRWIMTDMLALPARVSSPGLLPRLYSPVSMPSARGEQPTCEMSRAAKSGRTCCPVPQDQIL